MKLSARLTNAGVAGAALGIAAVGATAGVVAQRYALRRLHQQDDPLADEPFGQLPCDESRAVLTADGVPLYTETVLPTGGAPELTVVLVHGFCLDMGVWHFQRQQLAMLSSPQCRVICYDQPGHGRSGDRASGEYTLDQLATDLRTVLDTVAPSGPLVLIGHSMGGMTIMALAEQSPEFFAERVVGVGLLSTSAGHLDEVALGMPSALTRFRKSLMPSISGTLRSHPSWAERGRMAGSDLTYLLTRHYGFGSRYPSRSLVEYVERMNSATSVEVIAGYLGTLSEHDRYAALVTFAQLETMIVCGQQDVLTPVKHTREIAKLLPEAELVEVAEGGHLALMEQAELVNEHLVGFLSRVADRARSKKFGTNRRKRQRRR